MLSGVSAEDDAADEDMAIGVMEVTQADCDSAAKNKKINDNFIHGHEHLNCNLMTSRFLAYHFLD